MCGWTDDRFERTLSWQVEVGHDEVRPMDQLRFVRRAPIGFDASSGRWGLVPACTSLDEAKRYATFNTCVETLEAKSTLRAASAGHYARPALFCTTLRATFRWHPFVTGSPVGELLDLSSAYFRERQTSPSPRCVPPDVGVTPFQQRSECRP